MPTFEQAIVNNQIIITVSLSVVASEKRHSFKALLDTGAQITAISPRAIKTVGLVPIGSAALTVASGHTVPTLQYHAWVDIPIQYSTAVASGSPQNFFMGKQLPVAGLTYDPAGYDVLLGMDLLGIFHITVYGNRIILSN